RSRCRSASGGAARTGHGAARCAWVGRRSRCSRCGPTHAGWGRGRQARSIARIDAEALGERALPLLPTQPPLRLVEQPLGLAALSRDARDRDARALPDVVVVDLGDGRTNAALKLRLGGAQVVPLLLQRVGAGEVQLTRED